MAHRKQSYKPAKKNPPPPTSDSLDRTSRTLDSDSAYMRGGVICYASGVERHLHPCIVIGGMRSARHDGLILLEGRFNRLIDKVMDGAEGCLSEKDVVGM